MQKQVTLSMKCWFLKPSTGKDHYAAKAREFSFFKKKYEIFKVKFQKVPQVRESEQ